MIKIPSARFAVAAIILGAGRSVRMGEPKLLLPWGKTSVLGHLIAQWRELPAQQVAVVYARDDQAVAAELDRLEFPESDRIQNPAPERGMFGSIQRAALWKGWRPTVTHWAITLGDQPHLQMRTLRTVLEWSAKHPDKICQPARAGHGRHPVLLPKTAFADLGSSNAAHLKEFLESRTDQLAPCDLDDPGLDLDIDQPEDYLQAQKMAGFSPPPRPGLRTSKL